MDKGSSEGRPEIDASHVEWIEAHGGKLDRCDLFGNKFKAWVMLDKKQSTGDAVSVRLELVWVKSMGWQARLALPGRVDCRREKDEFFIVEDETVYSESPVQAIARTLGERCTYLGSVSDWLACEVCRVDYEIEALLDIINEYC